MKRLTIEIDEALRQKAKVKSMTEGKTLREIITDFLVKYVGR